MLEINISTLYRPNAEIEEMAILNELIKRQPKRNEAKFQ